jgi:hypothetical protein
MIIDILFINQHIQKDKLIGEKLSPTEKVKTAAGVPGENEIGNI